MIVDFDLKRFEQILLNIEANGFAWFVILSQLQLALRHPGNTDRRNTSVNITWQFAMALQQQLEKVFPELKELMDAGWLEEHDNDIVIPVPRKKYEA